MKILLIITLSVMISTPCFAQTYKWVDEKGGVHFTDDITTIPEKFRPKAEKIGGSEDKIETKIDKGSTPKKKEDGYKDQLGRGEEYWKNRVEEWKKKLKTAQENMEQARMKYNELTERFNESKSSAERNNLKRERDQVKQEMDSQKNKIEEAKMMLEKKIPEEVEIYKAKSEWIQQ
jgi:chromosome segregation ATPase